MSGPSINRAESSGDIWTIPGFGNYYVSKSGEVYSSSRRWKIGTVRRLRTEIDKDGYLLVYLTTQGRRQRPRVHQLVALAFLGDKPSPAHEVRHLDGNKLNNHYKNLAWGTRKDNADDRERHGRTAKGSRVGSSRLLPEDVAEIRHRVAAGEIQRIVAADKGVSRQAVVNILSGRTHGST